MEAQIKEYKGKSEKSRKGKYILFPKLKKELGYIPKYKLRPEITIKEIGKWLKEEKLKGSKKTLKTWKKEKQAKKKPVYISGIAKRKGRIYRKIKEIFYNKEKGKVKTKEFIFPESIQDEQLYQTKHLIKAIKKTKGKRKNKRILYEEINKAKEKEKKRILKIAKEDIKKMKQKTEKTQEFKEITKAEGKFFEVKEQLENVFENSFGTYQKLLSPVYLTPEGIADTKALEIIINNIEQLKHRLFYQIKVELEPKGDDTTEDYFQIASNGKTIKELKEELGDILQVGNTVDSDKIKSRIEALKDTNYNGYIGAGRKITSINITIKYQEGSKRK